MIPLVATLVLAALPADEEAAAALLAKAEARASEGRYEDAVRLYAELTAEHEGTAAGEVGRRRSEPNALLGWTDLRASGPGENRVDVVIAGDGYTLSHLSTFEKRADDVPRWFERDEVIGEYLGYFNFVRAAVVSEEDGVDAFDRRYSTAFEAYDTGKIENDVDVDRERARQLLDAVPSFQGLAVVLVRAGHRGTGRDGVAAVAERDPTALGRAFGGAFAGLGDELERDQGVPVEAPGAPNIAHTSDPDAVPWSHFLGAGVAGVGVYPGGLGRVDGVWKPVASGCAMEDAGRYCPVCREAIVLAIHRSVDPIESARPVPSARSAPAAEDLVAERRTEFSVEVMRPAEHALEVRWWVLPERGAPPDPAPLPGAADLGDRRARGPLPEIALDPVETSKPDRKGIADFTLSTSKLEPGRYRVVCRVRDTTLPRGEKDPWVLADPHGLLESERGWWVAVR
jgi:hypothetical protein